MWLGPPSTPPHGGDCELDENQTVNLRERVNIRGMDNNLGKVGEVETHLLAPSDVAGIFTVLAKNTCDGGGHRRLAFIKKVKTMWWQPQGRCAAL